MAKTKGTIRYSDFLAVPGTTIRLADIDPGFTHGYRGKQSAEQKLEHDRQRLCDLQDVFFAAARYGLLIIFQGMDAAGKDGAIKHVMAGVNPQGVDVYQFRQPSAEELSHDFLWRFARVLPARGRFGIFNRSYYEEVLVVRVHPKFLRAEAGARKAGATVWSERFDDINAFEHHLERSATLILKFFLHISKEEQRRRFLERVKTPDKNWKVSAGDVAERRRWPDYMRAYEDAINNTSSVAAPWYIIPSDHKWFARAVIGEIIVSRLEELNLSYPKVDAAQRALLRRVKAQLEKER